MCMTAKKYLTNHFISALAAVITITLLSACSPNAANDLSRAKAGEIVNTVNDYPLEKTVTIDVGHYRPPSGLEPQYKRLAQELNESGLGKGSYTKQGILFVTIELNDQGYKYIKSKEPMRSGEDFISKIPWNKTRVNVVTAVCKLGGIDGIAYLNESKTLARVEYTEACIEESTPIANLSYVRSWAKSIHKTKPETQRSLSLQRYDDGWREAASLY